MSAANSLGVSATSAILDASTSSESSIKGQLRPKSLPARADEALGKIPEPLASQLRSAFQGGTKSKDFVSPRYWDDDSKGIYAGNMLDAWRALNDYNLRVESVEDLVKLDALDVIARRVDDLLWGAVYLHMVFSTIRKLYRYIYACEIPPYFRHRLSYYERAARRDQWDLVGQPEDYIGGAVDLAVLAEVMESAGRALHAQTTLRDAALLALGAEVNFRTQEFHKLDVNSVSFESDGAGEKGTLFIPDQHCKNRRHRIGVIYDGRVLDLVRRLIGKRTSGPLLVTISGRRLSKASVSLSLRRASLQAVGLPVSANLLRRAGASDEDTPEAKGRRLGDRSGGGRTSTGVRFYSGSVATQGLSLLREV